MNASLLINYTRSIIVIIPMIVIFGQTFMGSSISMGIDCFIINEINDHRNHVCS